jgi:putative intracellular protease/amidase
MVIHYHLLHFPVFIIRNRIDIISMKGDERSKSKLKKKRVLQVVTSNETLGQTGYPAGFWLSELTHPYFELADNGIEVDIASPKGGKAPIDPFSDPRSPNSIEKDDLISIRFLNSPELVEKINNTKRLSEVDLEDYNAILFSGGSGAIFEYPDNMDVHKATRSMWESGKLVSSICAGGGALLNVKLSNGKNLIEGMTVTGFGNEEGKLAQQLVGTEYLPFYLESEIPKRGATFKYAGPNKSFVVVSGGGRLITGQQNLSGSELGKKLVEALTIQEESVSARPE